MSHSNTAESAEKQGVEVVDEPTVVLIGRTEFIKPDYVPWQTDTDVDSQALIEFAGRQCYRSWSNPAGRTNEGYIQNMMDMGHMSVIEHTFTSFHISGVSRSFTHELVRHRHLSFSQLSQRYVDEREEPVVEPEAISSDPELHEIFSEVAAHSQQAYEQIVERLDEVLADVESKTDRRKLARQAARSVLPNATQTEIVVSGNYRAWRHFLNLRCSTYAEAEIRTVAMKILGILKEESPVIFGDYKEITAPDGSRAAKPTGSAE